MALSLVDDMLDRDLSDFDEDLLHCDFFPNEDRLDSVSNDSSPCFNQLCTLCWKVHTFSSSLSNQTSSSSPANTLRKSNKILRLYFGNLLSYFLLMLMLRNLDYIRNPNVLITLAQLT